MSRKKCLSHFSPRQNASLLENCDKWSCSQWMCIMTEKILSKYYIIIYRISRKSWCFTLCQQKVYGRVLRAAVQFDHVTLFFFNILSCMYELTSSNVFIQTLGEHIPSLDMIFQYSMFHDNVNSQGSRRQTCQGVFFSAYIFPPIFHGFLTPLRSVQILGESSVASRSIMHQTKSGKT